MTKIQSETLKFIYDFINKYGWSPSIKEIQMGTYRKSYTSAAQTVRQLDFRGYIQRSHRLKRSIELTDEGLYFFEKEKANKDFEKVIDLLNKLDLTRTLKNKIYKHIAKITLIGNS